MRSSWRGLSARRLLRGIASCSLTGLAACGDGHPAISSDRRAAAGPDVVDQGAPPPAPSGDLETLGRAIREALAGDWEANYFHAFTDLNGDGRPEAVALVAGPMVCGTGGCPVMVFDADDAGGFRPVAQISVVQPPVRLSTRTSNGWRNLVVDVGGGGAAAGHAELPYGKTGYPANPTVDPAVSLADVDALEVLVPAFASYTDGTPVPLPPLAANVLGEAIHTDDADDLRFRVSRSLAGPYAQAKGIVVSAAEVQAYVAHWRAAMDRDRDRWAARRDAIVERLAAGDVPAWERGALESERQGLDELLTGLTGATAGDPQQDAELRAAREESARAFVWQWKLNQALYREYGGRIAWQQGGPEPLDAYRRWLEAARDRGDFAIVNAALESAFWRYYADDSIHEFLAPDSRDAAEAFDSPPWLVDR